jgi:hypothetical protein
MLDGLSRGPGQLPSADEVDVKVEHGLPRAGADVQDGAVALLDIAIAGDLGSREVAAADNFSVRSFGFIQSREMSFGDDKNVSRGLRADVLKSEDVVIFVDFFRGDLAAEDATEEARGSWFSHKKAVTTRKQ